MEEIVLILGYQASGKTTFTKEKFPAYDRLNRDDLGGTLPKLADRLKARIKAGKRQFVLDNTFPTKASRAAFINIASEANLPVRCYWLTTSLEDAQFNSAQRMIKKYGRLLDNKDMKATKDETCIPTVALYAYRKNFEAPTLDEGFSEITRVSFERKLPTEYTNKALILDYDGTLRVTKNNEKYPTNPNNILIPPNRRETLSKYLDKGFILTGVSNQSGIGSGALTLDEAISCFEKTNELLGHEIDYNFCPHSAFPLDCYCRKPSSGLGVLLIERYKLNPSQCIMVGDMTTDKTFATRCGFQYQTADKFFS